MLVHDYLRIQIKTVLKPKIDLETMKMVHCRWLCMWKKSVGCIFYLILIWRCKHIWQGSSKLVISINTSFVIREMRIDITLIYYYSGSWALVGWGTFSCHALGCHAFDGVDPNCYSPSYIGVLDYVGAPNWDAMVGSTKTPSLERLMIPWFVELETSQIVNDNNHYIGVNPTGIMTSHIFSICKLKFYSNFPCVVIARPNQLNGS
jgi:hypothetical protein